MVVHPAGSELLGFGSQAWGACRSQLLVGLVAKAGEPLGGAAGRFGITPDTSGGLYLSAPVDIDEERTGVHGLLGGASPTAAGYIAGGDGHQMGCHTEVGQCLDDPDGTQQVDLDCLIERRVEAHCGGRVDDGVARGQCDPTFVVQAEPVDGHVTSDRGHPARRHLGETVGAEFVSEGVEGVVAEDVAFNPAGSTPATGSNDEDQLAAGSRPQESFD